MCVTLYLVLQNHITVNHDQIEDWFSAYIGGFSWLSDTGTAAY